MTKQEIEKLVELIGNTVRMEGGWQEKRKLILDHASEEDITNLEEFASWFEPA